MNGVYGKASASCESPMPTSCRREEPQDTESFQEMSCLGSSNSGSGLPSKSNLYQCCEAVAVGIVAGGKGREYSRS